jgi:GTPase SAR1 family protein
VGRRRQVHPVHSMGKASNWKSIQDIGVASHRGAQDCSAALAEGGRMTQQSLTAIAAAVIDALDRPTPNQRLLLGQLGQQAQRLTSSTFQLAVLGQFKRGKSSLLNALMGRPLLSAGILPLTAVPTFILGSSKPFVRLKYLKGTVEEGHSKNFEEMGKAITAATTEESNPHNVKGIERVEVGLPSDDWFADVTLIDTPGIGSTHIHNTATAHAVLPECDAALFVLSVDPPITEVELEYLTTVCQNVSRVIVVLNKIDLVDPVDEREAIRFLSTVLSQRASPQLEQQIFPVSARSALAAKQARDSCLLEASGLPDLTKHIRSSLVDRKRVHLEASIEKKMRHILAGLEADAAFSARALAMPLAELDEKIRLFEDAASGFTRERANLEDLLSGEWRRAIKKLHVLCENAKERIDRYLDTVFADSGSLSELQSSIQSTMSTRFDEEFQSIGLAIDKDVAAAIAVHRERYQTLTDRVHQTAAALMNVRFPRLADEEWLEIKREPYWIGQAKVENLTSITVDLLARFLPISLRERRQRKKLRNAVQNAVTRNISDLRWTMQQNIDDSFRRLLSASNNAVDGSISSTREALTVAREKRRLESSSLQDEIEHAQETLKSLIDLSGQLGQPIEATADGSSSNARS